MKINYKKFLKIETIIAFLVFLFAVYFFAFGNKITVTNQDGASNEISQSESENPSSKTKEEDVVKNNITGVECKNGNNRPYAVMLAADKVARPLSGVSQADLVFEMPVITDGITRYMAVFVCEEPKEIGSIRSARDDFITLAKSMDAIFVHWGGSKSALDKLNGGIIDNLNALADPYNVFFRKKGVRPPHNGFTSFERMKNASDKLKYRQVSNFAGYPHTNNKGKTRQKYDININYPYPYNVKFRYDFNTNSYFRFVGGFKEVDKNTNKQVEVKNLIIMEAE